MHQILELIPLLLFLLVYKMDGQSIDFLGFQHEIDGIYSATAVLMAATVLQVLIVRVTSGTVPKRLWYVAGALLVFGALTLVLRNQLFIQWKPTVVNWSLAIALLVGLLFTKKNLIERLLGEQLSLPQPVWHKLNYLWIGNFAVVGAANLVVAYNFSESFWVSYKFYSAVAITLTMAVLTAALIMPHISDKEKQATEQQ